MAATDLTYSAKPTNDAVPAWGAPLPTARWNSATDALALISERACSNITWCLCMTAEDKFYVVEPSHDNVRECISTRCEALRMFHALRTTFGSKCAVRRRVLVPKKKTVHFVVRHLASGEHIAFGQVDGVLRVWSRYVDLEDMPAKVLADLLDLLTMLWQHEADCVAARTRRAQRS